MTLPKPEDLILTTATNVNKIYFREQFGHFQKVRRILASILILTFILLPFIQYNSKPAFIIDIGAQQIRFFALTFYPQDLLILAILFVLAAFALFYVTRLYGRVWCGYTCPQTIWMLMFNWLERRIEGTHRQSQALDKAKFSADKVIKKLFKHTIWLLLSLATATVFIAYFVPADELYSNLFNFKAYSLANSWILFFTLCTYINGGWIKEKMCLHMCPYARFQSALFDSSTRIVTYDEGRGENRGPRKRNMTKPETLGDCVDCKLCVEVCPVGIDIRNGLQYECINCGLCIDACDSVMEKFKYAKGLISYNWQKAPKKRWQQHLGYGGVCALTLLSLLYWFESRTDFEINVLRDRNALYRENYQGEIENTYTVKTLNKSQQAKTFSLTINQAEQFKLVRPQVFEVLPGEYHTQVVSVKAKPDSSKSELSFELTDLSNSNHTTINTLFYGPAQF